jgi:hypothetical protein
MPMMPVPHHGELQLLPVRFEHVVVEFTITAGWNVSGAALDQLPAS